MIAATMETVNAKIEKYREKDSIGSSYLSKGHRSSNAQL
jgi:hypothetical protein